jgi:hypothetical protein
MVVAYPAGWLATPVPHHDVLGDAVDPAREHAPDDARIAEN